MSEDDLTSHYHARRRKEALASIKAMVGETVDEHFAPDRHTVVLLPGGMGSELHRSGIRYQTMDSSLGRYKEVWLDAGILVRDLNTIPIDKLGCDEGLHIIRANGATSFLGVGPYDGTRKYFRDNAFNYSLCAFDWRRTLRECAELVYEFLLEYRRVVKDKFGVDPLPKTTLVGHSQGGMVMKSFLDLLLEKIDADRIGEYVHRVVSVGTGFYGVKQHLTRLYKGERYLNSIYGANKVAEVAASLLAPYAFLFIDRELWERDGEALGVERYPHRDADAKATADPYDPNNFSRYPEWVRPSELLRAKAVRRRLTQKLPSPVRERVFHIRSNSEETAVELYWSNVDGSQWDTSKENPVRPVFGDGDGGVPSWSAVLADTPKENVRDLEFGGEHARLMEYEETLDLIAGIVTGERVDRRRSDRVFLGGERASEEDVERFLTDEVHRSDLTEDESRRIWLRLSEELAFD